MTVAARSRAIVIPCYRTRLLTSKNNFARNCSKSSAQSRDTSEHVISRRTRRAFLISSTETSNDLVSSNSFACSRGLIAKSRLQSSTAPPLAPDGRTSPGVEAGCLAGPSIGKTFMSRNESKRKRQGSWKFCHLGPARHPASTPAPYECQEMKPSNKTLRRRPKEQAIAVKRKPGFL